MAGIDKDIRRRALAEWRGYWEPKKRPDRCKPASEGVAAVMKSLGLGERLLEQDVMHAWRDIVGDFLAQHSQPVSLKSGQLIVRVLQPAIHYELDRQCKGKILTEMKKRFGRQSIREVRFRLG